MDTMNSWRKADGNRLRREVHSSCAPQGPRVSWRISETVGVGRIGTG